MRRLVRIICCAAVAAALSACANGRLRVPGEDMVRARNEAADAFSRAGQCEARGDYEAAIEYYEQAMAYDGLYESAYYKTGRCYALLQEWEKARQVFGDISARDPENSTLKESLAYVYAMEGNYDDALALYGELVEERTYSASLRKSYIKVLFADGQQEAAVREFSRFQEDFPQDTASIKELYSLFHPEAAVPEPLEAE